MAAMRRLQDIAVSTAPDGALWTDGAKRIEDLCEQLEVHRAPQGVAPAGRAPHLPGLGHPLVPPWTLTDYGPDGVTMRGHFSRFHVGGNNAVHGGVIPLFFDWHFGMIVSAADRPISRTAYLHVDYRKVTPDRRTPGLARADRQNRRAEGVPHRDDDRRRRHRTIRSERPDDQAAPAPALRGSMTDPATQFTVPAAADAVAAVIGDREFIIQGDRRYTYAQIVERSNRLAAYLHSRGLGCKTERSELAGHEVGQDLLGIYAYNGPEYVEAMLGAWRARVAPFNVNYRYVKSELQYLLADSGATALLYHAAFAPRVAEVLPDLPNLRVLIQIADDSGNDLVHGAVDYESIVASGASQPPPVEPSPDDLYVLYTGGTTGMPKGVLWRAHDIFMTSFGGRSLYTGERHRVTRGDRQGRRRKPRHQAHGAATADARRRAVGGVHGHEHRPVRGALVGHQPPRPRRRRRHHRAGEGVGGDGGRRRDGATARRRIRAQLRPTCRRWRWSPTVARC